MNLDKIKIYKEDYNCPEIMIDKLFKSFNYLKKQHLFSKNLIAAELIHQQNLTRLDNYIKKKNE